MNISDAERVSAVLESVNYKKTLNIKEADLIVVAMCSIRQSAVDRVRGLIQKFEIIKKNNPKLKTVLTGCVLKKDKKILNSDFDCVVNIEDMKKIPELLGLKKQPKNHVERIKGGYLDIEPKHSSEFSASVPIMTGCNNFCAYCVVPYVREREVSRPAKEIVSEIKKLIKSGYKEIWLLGQNVNSYKNGKTNFPILLKMVNKIPGNFWIRFTSSHPKDFNDEVIRAMANSKKITPYLNLPIQSGDDKVLRSMKRYYTVKDYKNKIKKLRTEIPGIALSTDIIVGFPGETKKQFENTSKLFKDIKYDLAYINKYSTRYGTAAAKLKDNVSVVEKKRREKFLTEILKETALEKNKIFIGKETVVLIENKKNDYWIGKNSHYKTIRVYQNQSNKKSKAPQIGRFNTVKITEATPWSLKGEIINGK